MLKEEGQEKIGMKMDRSLFMVTPDESKMLEGAGDRMPLGALYVATSAKEEGHDVKFYDLNHISKEDFLKDVLHKQPNVIGYSIISSPSYFHMNKLLHAAKKLSPKTKHVVGGYHAIARPQDFPQADYVVRGDGEQAIVRILNNEAVLGNFQRVDINKLPYPDRNLVDNKYNMKQKGKKCATLVSSRGCPFNCVFCGNYDRKVRFRNPENIGGELEQLTNLGYESLYFLDDAFTVNKKHAKQVTDIVKGYGLPFRITTRADLLDEDLVSYMAKNGLEIVSIGIESGNDKVLERANKKTTTKQIENGVKLLHKYNIDVKGFFIFGLPGEGFDEAKQTIKFANKLKGMGLTSADFYAMTPFPGTPIYEHPEKYGCTILHHDWDKYLEVGKGEIEPVLETNWLSAKQIKYFMKEAKKQWEN